MTKSPLFIISGPTATGKTALAIRLAQELARRPDEFVVINFDSLLFYQELNIGTAKPSPAEMKAIPHLGVGIVSIEDEFNASIFVDYASEHIKEIHQSGRIPILVGGSGFYIRALIKGMYESESVTPEVKARAAELFNNEGIEGVRAELLKVDPEAFHALHPNDHYRNIRALEHFFMTGTPISQQREKFGENNPYDFSQNAHGDWEIHHIYLDIPKPEHWEIITARTAKMITAGLEQEVRDLLKRGHSPELKALGSIGYKETLDFIAGQLATPEEWANRISLNTRRLAKAQRTFFKKVTPKHCYHPLEDAAQIIAEAQAFLCNWPPAC